MYRPSTPTTQKEEEEEKGEDQTEFIGEEKTTTNPQVLLLVEFEEAFDSVLRSFVRKALSFFKFGPDIKTNKHTNKKTERKDKHKEETRFWSEF